MSKFVIKTGCDFSVELSDELTDFNDDQVRALKDINLIMESNGLINYGQIGLPKPR